MNLNHNDRRLRLTLETDLDRARATYSEALPPRGGEPTFDEVTTGVAPHSVGSGDDTL